MATQNKSTSSDCKMITLEEGTEGDHICSTEYFFSRIGGSVPLAPYEVGFKYDLESLPSRPLAVSESLQLIFVAHASGFWIAHTKDVMECAEGIKVKKDFGSIQELSIVDVPIANGKVNILALSADSSMLAVSVGGDIQFFFG